MAPSPWEAEVELGSADARALVAAQCPEVDVDPWESLGSGWDSDAYLAGGAVVFRFPRRALGAECLESERRWVPNLAPSLPVPIPVPRYVGRPTDAYPYSFLGHDLVVGTTLCRAELDTAAREALAPALGSTLRALHSIEIDGATASAAPGDRLGRADMRGRLEKYEAVCARLAAAGAIEGADEIEDLLRRLCRAAPWQGGPRWVHGDLYARHVLVADDGSLAGLIDWGDVHIGDPALDVSIAYSALPPSARSAFFAAYGGAADDLVARARYRALHYGLLLTDYGLEVGDAAMAAAGRYALGATRATTSR